MSAKKRNEMLAQGRCFTCEEVGHLARNCPKTTNVVSRQKGKPPGFEVHAARFSNARDSVLYESIAVLDTLPVGAVGLIFDAENVVEEGGMSTENLNEISDQLSDQEVEHSPPPHNGKKFPRSPEPRRRLGDLLEDAVRLILEVSQPYAGDEHAAHDERRQRPRFDVMRVSDNCYVVQDEYFYVISVLPLEYLREPTFSLACWYANIRAIECEVEEL
ncbi:hypothetical protein B0H17DRAFT_856329, partial [Mycena rosella]